MELLAKSIGQSTEVDAQLVIQTAVLSQLDDERLINSKKSQQLAVSPKRVGEHISISPVVFGSRRAVTIPEAVELFRIDPEDRKAALQQTLDERTPAQLDSDGDQLRLGAQLKQATGKLVHSFGTMFDRELGQIFPLGIEDTDLMRVVGPVDTCEQSIARFHIQTPPVGRSRTAAVLHRPCTGALGATPHGMCTSDLPAGTHVHPWSSQLSGPVWRSRRVAGSHIISDGENGTGAPRH